MRFNLLLLGYHCGFLCKWEGECFRLVRMHAWVGCTHTHVQVDMDQHVSCTPVVMETNQAT